MQAVTLANVDNLYAARQPASVPVEPTIFMIKSEVEATLKGRRKEPLILHRPEVALLRQSGCQPLPCGIQNAQVPKS